MSTLNIVVKHVVVSMVKINQTLKGILNVPSYLDERSSLCRVEKRAFVVDGKSGCGGIGRRDRFRVYCSLNVEVRVLSTAVETTDEQNAQM